MEVQILLSGTGGVWVALGAGREPHLRALEGCAVSDSPLIRLARKMMRGALRRRDESERLLFLAIFASLAVMCSLGLGFAFLLITGKLLTFSLATIVSSFLTVPGFLFLGHRAWEHLKRRWIRSGDEFDVTSHKLGAIAVTPPEARPCVASEFA